MLGSRLTFRDRLAPQKAGVSVSVFFYVKKAGRRERSKSQSEKSLPGGPTLQEAGQDGYR